jgi:hypothetical protein
VKTVSCTTARIHRAPRLKSLADHHVANGIQTDGRFAGSPRLTIRLRPFCSRISTPASPELPSIRSITCTSRNFVAALSCSRFFHAKKYDLHKACSRQNAVIVCPLRACSETSLRHFVHAFFERLVMSQLCNATQSFTRWGSRSAHEDQSVLEQANGKQRLTFNA